jgi:hypothetical protein
VGILKRFKDYTNLSHVIKFTAIFSFFAFFFISLLQIKLSNEDFWWHLATGKYIVENQSLPQNDPFLYTTSDTPSERKSFILKGYWLAQVIFYKVYSVWNLKGIIVLRAIFFVALLYFVFLNMKVQKVPDLVSLLVVSVVFWYTLIAEGERPQLLTFFSFSLTYFLLEDYRMNRSRKIYLVPILLMALSNMHPGYVICFVLLLLYLVGESIRYLSEKGRQNNMARGLLLICAISFLFSYMNPNNWNIFVRLISTRFFMQDTLHVVEMLPTFRLYSMKMIPVDYPYIIFLSLSLLTIRYFRKIGLVQMLLLIVFTIISMAAYRHLLFYMCIAAPVLARIFVFLKDEKVFMKLSGILKAGERFVYVAVSITGIFLIINASVSLAGFKLKGNEFFAFPKNAANFLKNVTIKGNMFNEYGFGGYLIWRLFPDKKAFIDTRSLEPPVTFEYRVVAFAHEGPGLSWKDIINKYNISYVVTRPLWQNGKVIPLVEELLNSDDWTLIYIDHLSLIFVRNDSDNSPVIEKYKMDKNKGFHTIIAQASGWAMTASRINPNYFITLGKMFLKVGKFEDAEKAFMMAHERDPDNKELKVWIQKLEQLKNKKSIFSGDAGK